MRTTSAAVIGLVAATAVASPALAATKTTTKASTAKTTCKVAADGRLTVTAKDAKTSKVTGGTETVALAKKKVSTSKFVVGKADSVCVAAGTYTVTLKTKDASVVLKKVVVAKDKVTKETVTVH